MNALNSAMPVKRTGNFCEPSTWVWASSSIRACWISTRSSSVIPGAAAAVAIVSAAAEGRPAANSSCSALTSLFSVRFSSSRRSSRSRIRARSGLVWPGRRKGKEANRTGQTKRLRSVRMVVAIEELLQCPAQLRRGKRFREISVHAEGSDATGCGGIGIRTYDDDGGGAEAAIVADAPDELESVHAWHVEVGYDGNNRIGGAIEDSHRLDELGRAP